MLRNIGSLGSVRQAMKMLESRGCGPIVEELVEGEAFACGTSSTRLSNSSWVFEGHFPSHPIMPGVYLVEAVVQTAALVLDASSVISKTPISHLYVDAISSVRFRTPVVPGDVLLTQVELSPTLLGGGDMSGLSLDSSEDRVAFLSQTDLASHLPIHWSLNATLDLLRPPTQGKIRAATASLVIQTHPSPTPSSTPSSTEGSALDQESGYDQSSSTTPPLPSQQEFDAWADDFLPNWDDPLPKTQTS